MYKLHPKRKISHKVIGNENTPVLIIDDFLEDVEKLRSQTSKLVFNAPLQGGSYPGIRAITDDEYSTFICNSLKPLLIDTYKTPEIAHYNVHEATFSLLSTPENELHLRQCMPHFDNPAPNSFAILHYINTGEFGGTAFYRHKPTGFERITHNRVEEYIQSAQAFAEKHGMHEQKYTSSSTNHYELIEQIEYRQNRLIAYPTSILHSGFISDPIKNISTDPETGRLTSNIFIEAM